MTTLAEQLRARSEASMARLSQAIERVDAPKSDAETDSRFWYPKTDQEGNGNAIIRFLDSQDEIPWISYYEHRFKGPTGLEYKELCPTTKGKGQKCPVCEYNRVLWNSKKDANIKQASSQKRKHIFVANILVVKYPAVPEQEGKVFLYRFGKQIYDKIKEKQFPTFEGEDKINPFDFYKGCNLLLKIRNEDGYRNYTKSEFQSQSRLAETDEQIAGILSKAYPLAPFVDESLFKSYDEMKVEFDRVMGFGRSAPVSVSSLAPDVGGEIPLPDIDDGDTSDTDFFTNLSAKSR